MPKRKQIPTAYDDQKFEPPTPTALDILVERILARGCNTDTEEETQQEKSI